MWQHAERPDNPIDVPYERAQRYEAAINAERAAHGLGPFGVGYPGLLTDNAPRSSSAGQALRNPQGIAVDRAGAVYVADSDNHRIVKLGPSLEVIATWGSFGRADGQLQLPADLTLDADGAMYVADWGNARVMVFAAEGRFQRKFGALRYGDLGATFSPRRIALLDSGEIAVSSSQRVYRFSSTGGFFGRWEPKIRLYTRCEVVVDQHGHVYGIAEGGATLSVVKLDSAGTVLASWGKRGHGPGEFFDPTALAVDGEGNVYVGDTAPRVLMYDARGSFIRQWEPRDGTAPGLKFPAAIAVDVGNAVYVADVGAHRVHRLALPRARDQREGPTTHQ
jgi:DNA-binding beta-propeller fold protein YncE